MSFENVKYVKVFNHHKLIYDRQDNFKHWKFSNIQIQNIAKTLENA